MKRESVITIEGHEIPDTLKALIEFLQDTLERVPEEFRNKAEVEFEPREDYEGHTVSLEVAYYRPETPEEIERKERSAKMLLEISQAEEKIRREIKAKYPDL